MSEILCISYFDEIYGPSTFYCNVPSLDDPDYPDLKRILDFNDEEGSFIFAFKNYQTINHLFYNKSYLARGGKDLLMISYMIKSAYFRKEIVDIFKYLNSKKTLLSNFALELGKMEQLPVVLRDKRNSIKNFNLLEVKDEKFREAFLQIYREYFNLISYKPLIEDVDGEYGYSKKIFVLGTPHSGKTTFLESIEKSHFYMQNNPDLPTRIYGIMIDNLTILSYDCFEQKLQCSQCENLGGCLENAQGFVIVFDLTDKNSILTAKEHFHTIINSYGLIESKKIPVLLIGNRMNGDGEPDDIFISKTFAFEELESYGMKMRYFKINLKNEGKKILKALRWMIKNLL